MGEPSASRGGPDAKPACSPPTARVRRAVRVAESRRAGARPLTFIFLTVFLDLLGVGILVPVLPFIVAEFRTDALTVGLLSLTFAAAQFLASPVLGAWSDRVGRRTVLLLSVLGTGVGYFIFGAAHTLWLLFLARLIDGFTGGNVSTAQAYIADVSAPADRAKNFGLIGAAFGLGFIIGPALGGILSHWSLRAPAYAAGILSLITVTIGYLVLPESLPPERRTRTPFRLGDLHPLGHLGEAIRRPGVARIFLAFFAMNFAMAGLQSNFAVFTRETVRARSPGQRAPLHPGRRRRDPGTGRPAPADRHRRA